MAANELAIGHRSGYRFGPCKFWIPQFWLATTTWKASNSTDVVFLPSASGYSVPGLQRKLRDRALT